MTDTNRISWIDMAKGWGIICVIIAHFPAGFLRDDISSFHMPLFFFLSGFVFQAYKYSWKSFLLRKIKTMIIPYFCLGTVMVLFDWSYYCLKGIYTASDLLAAFGQLLLQKRFCTIWFLTCLFLTESIFFWLVRLCRDNLTVIGVLICALSILGLFYYKSGGKPLLWNLDACAEALPFFYTGYLFANRPSLKKLLFPRKIPSVFLFFTCLAINVFCAHENAVVSGRGLEMFNSSYGFAPLTFLAAFSGIYCMLLFSQWFHFGMVEYIGKNSMLYFAWHQSILMPLLRDFYMAIGIPALLSVSQKYALILISVVLILLVLTAADKWIRNSGLSFMLGVR